MRKSRIRNHSSTTCVVPLPSREGCLIGEKGSEKSVSFVYFSQMHSQNVYLLYIIDKVRRIVYNIFIKIKFRKEDAMKKFHKILFLILMLALIVSAFAVVALADDEEEPTIEAKPAKINGWDFTFESVADGKEFQNSSDKKGKFVAMRQDDGNMIAITAYEAGSGSNAENLDFDWTTRLKIGRASCRERVYPRV